MAEVKIKVDRILSFDELHLSGGLRAGVDDLGHLTVFPTANGDTTQITIKNTSYAEAIRQIGLETIGWERISIKSEEQDSIWYVSEPNSAASDPNPADQWSWISHNARSKDAPLAPLITEIARNIAFSLRTSTLRLRDISREYGYHNEIAVRGRMTEGTSFAHVRTFDLFMALHSFLVEMCSARDYLSQFISQVLFSGEARSLKSLRKELRKVPQQHPIADKLREISAISDEGRPEGWMGTP